MATPKVSVIAGAYNVADIRILDKSIRSVLDQTFTDFEFILCDDGSSDGTYEILKRYADRDNRIKLIRNEENLGLVKTLNRCLEISSGTYVARHDCDDYNDLTRFEKQVAYLDEHTDITVLGTASYLFDEDGVWDKEIMPRKVENRDFLFNNPYKHGSIMMRREALQNVGGYRIAPETVRNEDYDLFMRMQTLGHGENLEEPLYYFCEDKAARGRRKYRYRINEAKVRMRGFKALGLMPGGFPYVIKPLIVGLIPAFILTRLQNRRRKKKNKSDGGETD